MLPVVLLTDLREQLRQTSPTYDLCTAYALNLAPCGIPGFSLVGKKCRPASSTAAPACGCKCQLRSGNTWLPRLSWTSPSGHIGAGHQPHNQLLSPASAQGPWSFPKEHCWDVRGVSQERSQTKVPRIQVAPHGFNLNAKRPSSSTVVAGCLAGL